VAGQVNSVQVPVAPNAAHTIEARGLVNTTAPDAFEYDPVSSKTTVAANQTKAALLKLGKPREKCTGGMALINIASFLRRTLVLNFAGPENKNVTVPAGGSLPICLIPGQYKVTSNGRVINHDDDPNDTGLKDFQSGGCWTLYYWDKADPTPTNVSCSFNVGDYKRP
jgi:hypothetical protein